ncbi:Multiple antibiotic resistance protein MarA [Vibrio aerogenes CECT 7868]|uniref:Multiple antibiotic resistance protein MarA n=1 Tax=Vibrio aerogenes CECT 7868 TaxID=1216006 RepID=A0A1M5ZQB7_9VIBR|nr:AraC family transcriptional regulator [Vibrio aerogenes]SHI26296.1 Multiple antibiotic resistance protein MarA [Vibrio aerogenes CECT 7868]
MIYSGPMTPELPANLSAHPSGHFSRIERVLDYIHDNIRMPLTLDMLSGTSCWSRWQLQRVFQAYTGYSVAQYVREMKLSRAAEMVLTNQYRMSDIAYEFGFNSEVAFSRAFKQYFGIAPKAYQTRGLTLGIKAPLTNPNQSGQLLFPEQVFYQVRIDQSEPCVLHGLSTQIKGLYSPSPDFMSKVPELWHAFFHAVKDESLWQVPHIGVIEHQSDTSGELTYRAGIRQTPDMPEKARAMSSLPLPTQTCAVMRYQGKVSEFHQAVLWLLSVWLPESGYSGVDDAPSLEFYYPPFDQDTDAVNAEYWLPVSV